MAETQGPRGVDLDNFVGKSGKEKRSIIKNILGGTYDGRTKEDVDRDKVMAIVQDAFKCKELNPYLSLMLDAMEDSGCPVDVNSHIAVKVCGEDSDGMLGSFNHEKRQIEICQDTFADASFPNMRRAMQIALSQTMVYAYDHCRAKVDVSKPEHSMCTSLRAAALSGLCSSDIQLLNHAQVAASLRGYQTCVLQRAVENFLFYFPSWNMEQTKGLIKKVFPTCFNDHSPYDRLPYDETQAELSYKAYISRNRYNV